MNDKIIFKAVFCFIFLSGIFAFSFSKPYEQDNLKNTTISLETETPEEIPFLESEETHFLENPNSTETRIISNEEKVSVYINGEYFGTTPLTIKDLTPASYILTVTKNGKKNTARIEIKRNLFQQYYIELQ